ncbi:MAG TPA: hypothetical protein VN711_01840, partial [Candidatus Saccharimonadales bacterium]|nr:hypothetical protein [Candidatus Saccharimonadales bacterium]
RGGGPVTEAQLNRRILRGRLPGGTSPIAQNPETQDEKDKNRVTTAASTAPRKTGSSAKLSPKE